MTESSSQIGRRAEDLDDLELTIHEPSVVAVHPPVIWLPGGGGTPEQHRVELAALASAGLVAVSFDPYQHGTRGTESPEDLMERVFANFRRYMWPILGQTTVDMLRVIDWLVDTYDCGNEVYAGGLSMGGDIAVAAAGVDHRISRVAAIIATPDWLRPGMEDLTQPGRVLPPGDPDGLAQWFYDELNPLTHLDRYSHGPAITFECGQADTHVPPDGALRFIDELSKIAPEAAADMRVNLHPCLGHLDYTNPIFIQSCIDWLTASDLPNSENG